MASGSIISGYYICNTEINIDQPNTGIEKKILSQVDCFNHANLNCELLLVPNSGKQLRKGLGSLPGISDGYLWPRAPQLSNADYFYIRRPYYSSKEFITFLRDIRRENPKALIVIEMPTYPYDSEMNKPSLYFALRKDRKYRARWRQYVTLIANITAEKSIFGIQTIQIGNGIDLNKLQPRKPSLNAGSPESVHIACIASFSPWHGYDLLLNGLDSYYRNGGNRDICLHFAGTGPALHQLKQIVSHSNYLKDHAVFHGTLNAIQLDDLYNSCTLATGCLALHRRSENITDTSIKTREYIAKGIPFFCKGKIDCASSSIERYYLSLPSDESNINIQALLQFYDALYSEFSEQEVIANMREIAKNTVSMDIAMRNIIQAIKANVRKNT